MSNAPSQDPVVVAALAATAAAPDVQQPTEEFVGELRRRVASGAQLSQLVVADVYLAWAALRGDAAATAEIDRRLKACGQEVSGELSPEDLVQRTRCKLFLGVDGGRPALAGYSGRGAMVSWIRTILRGLVIDNSRRQATRVKGESELMMMGASEAIRFDVGLMMEPYRKALNSAFQSALGELEARERLLLRMRYVDRSTIEDIGKTFAVHRTTAMRWLDATCEKVLQRTRAVLQVDAGLSTPEVESLLRDQQPSFADRLSGFLR